eukprot:jgi/Mesen1/8052/ME000043S07439
MPQARVSARLAVKEAPCYTCKAGDDCKRHSQRPRTNKSTPLDHSIMPPTDKFDGALESEKVASSMSIKTSVKHSLLQLATDDAVKARVCVKAVANDAQAANQPGTVRMCRIAEAPLSAEAPTGAELPNAAIIAKSVEVIFLREETSPSRDGDVVVLLDSDEDKLDNSGSPPKKQRVSSSSVVSQLCRETPLNNPECTDVRDLPADITEEGDLSMCDENVFRTSSVRKRSQSKSRQRPRFNLLNGGHFSDSGENSGRKSEASLRARTPLTVLRSAINLQDLSDKENISQKKELSCNAGKETYPTEDSTGRIHDADAEHLMPFMGSGGSSHTLDVPAQQAGAVQLQKEPVAEATHNQGLSAGLATPEELHEAGCQSGQGLPPPLKKTDAMVLHAEPRSGSPCTQALTAPAEQDGLELSGAGSLDYLDPPTHQAGPSQLQGIPPTGTLQSRDLTLPTEEDSAAELLEEPSGSAFAQTEMPRVSSLSIEAQADVAGTCSAAEVPGATQVADVMNASEARSRGSEESLPEAGTASPEDDEDEPLFQYTMPTPQAPPQLMSDDDDDEDSEDDIAKIFQPKGRRQKAYTTKTSSKPCTASKPTPAPEREPEAAAAAVAVEEVAKLPKSWLASPPKLPAVYYRPSEDDARSLTAPLPAEEERDFRAVAAAAHASSPARDKGAPSKPASQSHATKATGDQPGARAGGAVEKIMLKMVTADGPDLFFRVRPNESFGRLFGGYAKKVDSTVDKLQFLFDGKVIKVEETPACLELEDEDQIEVRPCK